MRAQSCAGAWVVTVMAVASPPKPVPPSSLPSATKLASVALGSAVALDGAGLVPFVAADRPFLAVVEVALGFTLMLAAKPRIPALSVLTLYTAATAANITAVIVSDRGKPLSTTMVDFAILCGSFLYLVGDQWELDELW